jgi:hypothetical protein
MILKHALKTGCVNCEVYLPIDWKINEKQVVQANLLVVSNKVEKQYLDFTPALVVEVLSPSTAYKDRHEKFELYEEQSVSTTSSLILHLKRLVSMN